MDLHEPGPLASPQHHSDVVVCARTHTHEPLDQANGESLATLGALGHRAEGVAVRVTHIVRDRSRNRYRLNRRWAERRNHSNVLSELRTISQLDLQDL